MNDTPDERAAFEGEDDVVYDRSGWPHRASGAARVQPLPPADEPIIEGWIRWEAAPAGALKRGEKGYGMQQWLAAQHAPETAEPPALSDECPQCKGSGTMTGTVGQGPDGWPEDFECNKCHGTGAIPDADNYVAWMRFARGGRPVLCDSDAEGAFKVYRWQVRASTPPPEQASTPGVRPSDSPTKCPHDACPYAEPCGWGECLDTSEQASTPRAKPDDEGCLSLEDAAEAHFIDSDLQPQILTKLDCFCEGRAIRETLARPPSEHRSRGHPMSRAAIGSKDVGTGERIVHEACGHAGYDTLCGVSLSDDMFKVFKPARGARINCLHCHAIWQASAALTSADFSKVLR